MNVLIACEFTATVRDAFRALGHNAWSCDLEPTEGDHDFHLQCDVRKVLDGPDGVWLTGNNASQPWDLLIAHPPCTYLAVSGARWNHTLERQHLQAEALDFVRLLLSSPISKIALENPISKISSAIRKPDQIIQPWMFGVAESKATCLWLKNLPLLKPTKLMYEIPKTSTHRMAPSATRGQDRSRTLPEIAAAMARQWSEVTARPKVT